MSTEPPITLDQMRQNLLDQIAAELGQLPAEDFRRLARATIAGEAGTLFRACLYVARAIDDRQVRGYAAVLHGQHLSEAAAQMERLGDAAGPKLANTASTQAARLQAEADAMYDTARRWLGIEGPSDGEGSDGA